MMKVLLDAGHGIDTPGKRSPDGSFREYLWNRQVAGLVLARLNACGIDADLVVTETNDISLRTRAMRVNKVCDQVGASNVILVSIHSNAAGNGKTWMNAQGWCCFTSPGKTKADAIAERMYEAFTAAFPEKKMRRDTSDGDSDYEENFYVLTKTRCPAVLLENFFFDNKEECAWLLRCDTKVRIADAIVAGIKRYLNA
jgi:N-acetylmuramoyl-L-alanine amidase